MEVLETMEKRWSGGESRILPKERPVEIYLWTGDCTPTAEHMDLLASRSLLNLNGGDPRLDRDYPSITCPHRTITTGPSELIL